MLFKPDLNLILLSFIDYLKKYNVSKFLHYLEATWGDMPKDVFWDTYYQMKQSSFDLYSDYNQEKTIFLISDFESYHILIIMIDFLKEHGDPEFLQSMEQSWDEQVRDSFWETYYQVKQSLFNYYFLQLDNKLVNSIADMKLYHLLLIMIEYFKEFGEPDFFSYLETTFEASARETFWDSYYYIKQYLFDYYSNLPKDIATLDL